MLSLQLGQSSCDTDVKSDNGCELKLRGEGLHALCTSSSNYGAFWVVLQLFPFQSMILTVVTVETSPNKLVVVRDLVDNSTQTADTVLYNL